MKFNVFGSKSSIDRDVLVFLDELPSLEECKKLSKEFNEKIFEQYADEKKVNTNLGVIRDGLIVKIFKGTIDEVNNSLIDTYDFHEQKFPLLVANRLPRNLEVKIIRVARILLSFFSKTENRKIIKDALKGNFALKTEVLSSIDFGVLYEFNKNSSLVDVYKNIAFQLGQVIALDEGVELYGKEEIAQKFPDLTSFLMREESKYDLLILQKYKEQFVNLSLKKMNTINKLSE